MTSSQIYSIQAHYSPTFRPSDDPFYDFANVIGRGTDASIRIINANILKIKDREGCIIWKDGKIDKVCGMTINTSGVLPSPKSKPSKRKDVIPLVRKRIPDKALASLASAAKQLNNKSKIFD
ncbi:hypothetical protein K7432_017541 [Basidiobolus ranarum]|uniref:Uncharacterized protein n=1 Tax=Basidiobolus ranarum TaxID=34480 RepID=A0ABR2WD80_9FUNG